MRTTENNANGRSGYQKAARGAQMVKGAVKMGSGIASGNFVAVAQGVVEVLAEEMHQQVARFGVYRYEK